MNVFFLDSDPSVCAHEHVDSHCIKMILESGQIMATAHHLAGGEPPPGTFKPTHVHHPCCKWAASSIQNYQWLGELGMHLCREYTERYGRVHARQDTIVLLAATPPRIQSIGFTSPAQAMPDELRMDDPILAYRRYYNEYKSQTMRMVWKHGDIPVWYRPLIEVDGKPQGDSE